MPKLSRWIVAEKKIEIFNSETKKEIMSLGGHIGGGFDKVHQHIFVTPDNKEKIEKMLIDQGFEVSPAESADHPEFPKK